MNFHIITLFPDAFTSYLGESILKRAIEDEKIRVFFYDPKEYEADSKKRLDDKPYGGGPGMVIRAEPTIRAIEKAVDTARNFQLPISNIKEKTKKTTIKIIWLSPSGKEFSNNYAKKAVKKYTDIIIVCGRYEGIDDRVKKVFKTEDISVGPFVLTGGELPAMLIMDVMSRQVSGVLGDINSLEELRIASPRVYTRPEILEYKGKKYKVPKVLLSGDHKKIEEWRKEGK